MNAMIAASVQIHNKTCCDISISLVYVVISQLSLIITIRYKIHQIFINIPNIINHILHYMMCFFTKKKIRDCKFYNPFKCYLKPDILLINQVLFYKVRLDYSIIYTRYSLTHSDIHLVYYT